MLGDEDILKGSVRGLSAAYLSIITIVFIEHDPDRDVDLFSDLYHEI